MKSRRVLCFAFPTVMGLAVFLFGVEARGAEKVRLHVRTLDSETGGTVAARVYLTDPKGVLEVPAGSIVYRKSGEEHFVTRGEFDIDLDPGVYNLRVERGPEFHPWKASVELGTERSARIDVRPERWISMNKLGWYSADLHNHRGVDDMPALLLAEDLNLAPTLTDWIWEDKPISRPPETADAIRRVDSSHVYSVLDKEVERLEWGPGAVDLLGLRTIILFDGDRLTPPNDHFCRLAHAQGAYVDAEKIVWRDAAALAALGHLDFAGIVHNHFNRHGVELETDAWGMIPKEKPEYNTVAGMPLWSMDVYYRFLNCGFRIAVSAGSASGVKAAPLGYDRVYARLEGPFSYEDWFRALKTGKSFGTNGPMLFLRVNDQDPGGVVGLKANGMLKVRAEASSDGPLDRLEIIMKGKVIKTVSSAGPGNKLVADLEILSEGSGWIAARCFEKPDSTIRFAQTSPVYYQTPGRSPVVAADAKYFLVWMDREMEFYRKETRFKTAADREAMLAFFEKARKVYASLAAENPN